MALIRTIKPEFWVDEKIVECSIAARLLFIGLWNFSDNAGRMEYRPAKIRMQIFPADSLQIPPLIGELERENLIQLYTVDNKEYLQVINFSKHQKIDKRYPSKYPEPANSRQFPQDAANSPRSNGKEWKGRDIKDTPPEAASILEKRQKELESEFWKDAECLMARHVPNGKWRGMAGKVFRLYKEEPWVGLDIIKRGMMQKEPMAYINKAIQEDEKHRKEIKEDYERLQELARAAQ